MKQTEILTRVTHVNELHESKFPFVSRIKFIRSKLSNFSAHVSGVNDSTEHTNNTGPSPRAAAHMGFREAGARGAI